MRSCVFGARIDGHIRVEARRRGGRRFAGRIPQKQVDPQRVLRCYTARFQHHFTSRNEADVVEGKARHLQMAFAFVYVPLLFDHLTGGFAVPIQASQKVYDRRLLGDLHLGRCPIVRNFHGEASGALLRRRVSLARRLLRLAADVQDPLGPHFFRECGECGVVQCGIGDVRTIRSERQGLEVLGQGFAEACQGVAGVHGDEVAALYGCHVSRFLQLSIWQDAAHHRICQASGLVTLGGLHLLFVIKKAAERHQRVAGFVVLKSFSCGDVLANEKILEGRPPLCFRDAQRVLLEATRFRALHGKEGQVSQPQRAHGPLRKGCGARVLSLEVAGLPLHLRFIHFGGFAGDAQDAADVLCLERCAEVTDAELRDIHHALLGDGHGSIPR
eukprot:scaffold806_cov229-Pinguiococcus_pyrenoidosus.AAC.7